jgi:ISXO2 transposase-like protein
LTQPIRLRFGHLGVQYKTSFVLAHKMREAMASEVKASDKIGGEGRKAEIDGGYFGGYVKPANLRENRRDRRLRQYQSGKQQCVVVIRERDGVTLPGVFRSEGEALDFIRRKIARGAEVHADESGAWNPLYGHFIMKRVNHQEAYSLNDASVSDAESFFSRMRRAEIGHHHHIAGPYLIRFAQEMAWREDHRKDPNGSQVDRVVTLAMRNRPSLDFCGYWQRSGAS